MVIYIPVLLNDLFAFAKMAPWLQEEFPSQIVCHLTNASFVLCIKSTLKTTQILRLDSFIWTCFGISLPSNVFFNKNKLLTSHDMNSWVGLWLGHTLPKATGWAHWLSFKQPYFMSYSTLSTAKNYLKPSSSGQKTLNSCLRQASSRLQPDTGPIK